MAAAWTRAALPSTTCRIRGPSNSPSPPREIPLTPRAARTIPETSANPMAILHALRRQRLCLLHPEHPPGECLRPAGLGFHENGRARAVEGQPDRPAGPEWRRLRAPGVVG